MFLSNFSLLYPSWGSYVFYGTLSNIDLIPYTHFAYGETGQDGGDKISSTCAGWETRISAWQEHLFLSLNIDGRRASEIFVSYLFLIPYSFITISSGTGHKHSGPRFSFMNSGTEALAQYLIRGAFLKVNSISAKLHFTSLFMNGQEKSVFRAIGFLPEAFTLTGTYPADTRESEPTTTPPSNSTAMMVVCRQRGWNVRAGQDLIPSCYRWGNIPSEVRWLVQDHTAI